MQVNHHPATDMLIDHATGALSPGLCVSVSAHLHFCESCRERNKALLSVGGDIMESAEPIELGAHALQSVFDRIDDDEHPTVVMSEDTHLASDEKDLPTLVKKLIPDSGAKWKFLSPALRVSRLTCGENQYELALHKIKGNGKTPVHDHKGLEITVVLQGSFSDEDGIYAEGDFLIREPGQVHRPIATNDDQCICLSVSEAPIRLTGAIHRVLNPFFSVTPR